MHGNIARWLRILGFDTHYSKTYTDKELLEQAEKWFKKFHVVIVSSDKDLIRKAERKGYTTIYIKPEAKLEVKLALILRKLGFKNISLIPDRSRCPLCNSKLIKVKPDEIGRFSWKPPSIAGQYWYCPRCRQIYWVGEHFKSIRAIIERVNNILGER